MTQKQLARDLKIFLKCNYKINGWNIYLSNARDHTTQEVVQRLEDLNTNKELGYKRFRTKDSPDGKTIFSIPFGLVVHIAV